MKFFLILFISILIFPAFNLYSQQEPSQYLQEGMAAVEDKAYSDAVNYLTQYLKSDPQNAVGRFNRAVAYFFLQDFHNALRDASVAIDVNSNYKAAYNLRGLINTALNIFSGAINDFTSAINLDPNYGEAYMNRGLVYKLENDYTMAVSDLNYALSVNPALVEAYYYRGDVQVSMGNYNNAIKDLNTFITNSPNKAAAYSARGLAYYQTGKYEEAVKDLEKAITLNPNIENDFIAVINDARSKAGQK